MSTSYTPEVKAIHNEFDRFGLLLGLPRLEGERNVEYKVRLQDVFVHRANSTYLGLIHGITRELGLSIFEALKITALTNTAAIVFDETKCYIYSDMTQDDGLVSTLDRFELDEDAYTLEELNTQINNSGYFNCSIYDGIDPQYRAMTIYNQSNVVLVPNETLSSTAQIKLNNINIISNSIVIRSPNLTEHVLDPIYLVNENQYYIDTENGIFYGGSVPAEGSSIRYKYQIKNFNALASPVIIHNINSNDFKTKMFEQTLNSDGTYNSGLPTIFGADIINELYSVYGLLLGK